MDRTAAFYSGSSYRFGGGGFPVYSGSRRQTGGSILGAVKRVVVPVARALGVKILKKGAKEALGFARNVAEKALTSQASKADTTVGSKEQLKDRLRSVAKFSASEGLDALENMIGSGRRRRRPRRIGTRKPLRKRKAKRVKRRKCARKKRGAGKALF